MQPIIAECSLVGHREDNQDRVCSVVDDGVTLIAAVDGMGGHAGGARAAEVTVATLTERFAATPKPLLDPVGFLHRLLAEAHEAVVDLGTGLMIDVRPRATCALALVQDEGAWWAHVGDSRIYQLRDGRVLGRTRDHSHVELLLQRGLISEEEVERHPMRNFVESCLGGDRAVPSMSITRHQRLTAGDVLLACTDGFWSGVPEPVLARLTDGSPGAFTQRLGQFAAAAVTACAPYADNTSVVALRWHG